MRGAIINSIETLVVKLEKDKQYYYCACGKSKKQPFCDGSHSGTEIKPIKFKAEFSGENYLCGCKASSIEPFCDGSHCRFSEEDIGKQV